MRSKSAKTVFQHLTRNTSTLPRLTIPKVDYSSFNLRQKAGVDQKTAKSRLQTPILDLLHAEMQNVTFAPSLHTAQNRVLQSSPFKHRALKTKTAFNLTLTFYAISCQKRPKRALKVAVLVPLAAKRSSLLVAGNAFCRHAILQLP